ncbi:hypothetical protein DFH08DRAFT_787850 [Mycena albidolilacea]|uniref:Uncharacterized protein n=1 Tax=Mycena albidolilacea TaxID=1033008 RepID=A0AAD6ZIC0_9AGAR|nr:hypothetical protein DFH08DRAFT_787850 [Mycena albidolilacea]
MELKACAWACSDESWAVPNASILPTFLRHLLEGDLKGFQADLCDLTSPDSDLDLEWNVDVEIIRQRDKTLYSIRPCGSEHSGHSILLESAATVLQILRSGWGRDFALLIRNLVELGAEFHPSWKGPAHCAPLTPPSINTLGRRPASYKLTLVDFGVYVQRRDAFLCSPRGCAALFYGGIVRRLAHLAIPDFQDIACLDPSEDILKAGACVLNGNGEEALWHEALTLAEIDPICRVYSAEDGQQLKYISWWPTPTAFWSSGLNMGWWNANCERWFVKRMKDIEGKSAKLYTYPEWKNKIRFSTSARKVSLKNDDLSAQYLAVRLQI